MNFIKNEILEQLLGYDEGYFKTKNDPNQIPVSKKTVEDMLALHKKSIAYSTSESGDLIGLVTVVPTTREDVKYFLEGKITEYDLLLKAVPQKKYEALYICSAFVEPTFRGQGIAFSLLMEIIRSIPLYSHPVYAAWLYSNEGEALIKKIETTLKIKIQLKL